MNHTNREAEEPRLMNCREDFWL